MIKEENVLNHEMTVGQKFKKVLWNAKAKINYAVFYLMFQFPTTVFAEEKKQEASEKAADTDLSWLSEKGNGAFDNAEKAVKQTGLSGISFIRTCGIIALLVAVMLSFIAIAMKKGSKREEGKDNLFWAVVGGAGLFAAVAIVTMIASFGQSFAGSAQ